jgi:hypothetical protein
MENRRRINKKIVDCGLCTAIGKKIIIINFVPYFDTKNSQNYICVCLKVGKVCVIGRKSVNRTSEHDLCIMFGFHFYPTYELLCWGRSYNFISIFKFKKISCVYLCTHVRSYTSLALITNECVFTHFQVY